MEPNTYTNLCFESNLSQNFTKLHWLLIQYLLIIIKINIFSIVNFRGCCLGNHSYVKILFSVLLGYIWLLGTFVNSSGDINTLVQNCCRNLAVRGLMTHAIDFD